MPSWEAGKFLQRRALALLDTLYQNWFYIKKTMDTLKAHEQASLEIIWTKNKNAHQRRCCMLCCTTLTNWHVEMQIQETRHQALDFHYLKILFHRIKFGPSLSQLKTDIPWIKVVITVFHRPTFLEKKIRGTKQPANYLYIFHSNPKHLPKVKSRGLVHSDKGFFMWFSRGFAKQM